MRRWMLALLLVGAVLWPAGGGDALEGVRMEVQLSMNPSGEVEVITSVIPIGRTPLQGRTAEVRWALEQADGDVGLMQVQLPTLLPLASQEAATYVSWRGALPLGLYALSWGASCEETEHVTFRILEEDDVVLLEAEARYLDPESEHVRPLPDEPAWTGDPEARRLAAWARAALAGSLEVAREEIEILEVIAREFPDASLGVREPGMLYAQVITPGYVIRLQWGDRQFEYRAAGDRLLRLPELPAHWPPADLWVVQTFAYNADIDVALHGEIACSPEAVLALPRWVDEDKDPIEAALRFVLGGELGLWEIDAGYSTEYPLPGLELLDFELESGVLTVRLDDPQHATSGGTCRVTVLRAQLEEAALQFSEVDEVVLQPEELFQP